MRKNIIISISLIFLSISSFALGAFMAENGTGGFFQKTLEMAPEENKDEIKILPNDEDVVEVVAKEEEKTVEKEEKPAEEKKTTFAIIGDTQYFKPGVNGGYQKAVGNIKKMNPDLVFAVGDLVGSCEGGSECERKINSWKSVLGSLVSKTYVMMGNHDRIGEKKSDLVFQKLFSFPSNGPEGFSELTYSFDYDNSHFVVLSSDNPEEYLINNVQRNWLESDLNKNFKENIFVFFHEPAYPTNSKIGESLDENSKDRDSLWNILTKHKVKAVFSGHEHIQSRRKVNGIYQFVFGNTDAFNHLSPKAGMAEYSYVGAGFGAVEITGKEITVKTYSVDGSLLNSFVLPK
jgi:3',5'-cyclic AMP phosphodiesterase CpdA